MRYDGLVVPYLEVEPGLFVVRYAVANELAPALQVALVDAVRARAATQPVGLVFEVGPAVQAVTLDVPTYWLQVTAQLNLKALAVASSALSVKIATLGFAAANRLRRLTLPVESFADETAAIAWVRGHLHPSG